VNLVSGGIVHGELLKDRYRLERLLGRGGMAAVWLGHDEVLDRPVAVKVLSDTIASDPEFVARFRREAKTAAGVAHPNLVGVYDFSDGEERPYLVMQFVPGQDLGQVLARDGHVDCERLARELLDALAHIHAVGIVHRDVKPGNILIGRDGSAKLIDFGIAQPADATALTRTGLILGTERYAAPEVMQGRPATERSDLYSCGVVLRSCLDQAGGSAAMRGLVEWLASDDPRARPPSAKQALARLERGGRRVEEPTQALRPVEPTPPALEPPPTSHRGRWGAAAAILGALAAIAVAVALVTGGGGGDSPKTQAAKAKSGKSRSKQVTKKAAETTPAAAPAAAPEGSDPALGAALNEEGFALIQAGEYEAAVPVLEEAVRAFPPETEDVNYAYALFNLGNALRLSGRAEEAIPVLEQRLEIPDQTETVRQELEAARQEAG
jgi:eukaryotic-like serine/threonine-protein kinase